MEQETKVIETNKRRKGGFVHDGSVHYSGIKNEHNIINLLNNTNSNIGNYLRNGNSQLIFEHRGGTRTKNDGVLINQETKEELLTLSIKNHKKKGTFDWLNSTKEIPESININLKNELTNIKQNYTNIEQTRIDVDNLFSNTLSSIKEDESLIRNILNNIYDKYTNGIIINCESENRIIYFNKEELKELRCFEDNRYYLKHKQGSCSAQIMRRCADKEINTNLRIRLVLNNGVTALVGQSKSNSSSSPCIKIQQDNVNSFLENIETKVIESL